MTAVALLTASILTCGACSGRASRGEFIGLLVAIVLAFAAGLVGVEA